MTSDKREQVWVGAFVIVAVAVLVGVVISVSGKFDTAGTPHRAYFKFAGGLVPAARVRFGGLLAGQVERLRVDPGDSTRIEVEFRVRPEIPVKTDSVAKVAALGALGENYLEITTGSNGAPLAPPGSVLLSRETLAISDLGDVMGGLAPDVQQVLHSLNERLVESKITIARINDLLGDTNQQNISGSMANLNALLADARPKVSAALSNINEATGRLPAVTKNVLAVSERVMPVLENLQAAIKQGNDTLARVDAILVENRPEIRATLAKLQTTLDSANVTVETLKSTLERNGENLDESLANVREATGNLKDLTDTVKRKPSVLIRGETGKDRLPGGTK